MKLRVTIVMFAFAILLVGCGQQGQGGESTTIEAPDDIKELVNDYSTGAKTDVQSASITGTELIVTEEDESETIYDLPEDEFFVSIAPFINETHP